MAHKVNLPDGRVVNFPDSMSDADVNTAVSRIMNPGGATPQSSPAPPDEHPFISMLKAIPGVLGQTAKNGISRFGQAMGEDSSTTGDALQGLLNQATSGHPLDAIGDIVKGIYGGQQDQQQQMQHENPIRAGLRQGINSTPLGLLLGPQINRGLDRTLHGDPAGGLSDAVQLTAMTGGPEALEALQSKAIGGVGESMVTSSRKALLRDPELLKELDAPKGLDTVPRLDHTTNQPIAGPTEFEQMLQKTQDLNSLPARGRAATPSVQRAQAATTAALADRNARLAANQTPIRAVDAIDPAYQYTKKLIDSNQSNAGATAKELAGQIQDWTKIAPKVDKDGRPLEGDWEYVNRALLEDKGKPATEWQATKDNLRDIQKSEQAPKTSGELQEMGGPAAIRGLLIHGVGDALNHRVGPEIGQLGREMNQTIAIQAGLENMAKEHPEWVLGAAQHIAAGAGAGAGVALGFGHAGEIGIGSVAGGVTGALRFLSKRLATDPVARAQMGDFLNQHRSNRAIPQIFGNVPRLRILGGAPSSRPSPQNASQPSPNQ